MQDRYLEPKDECLSNAEIESRISETVEILGTGDHLNQIPEELSRYGAQIGLPETAFRKSADSPAIPSTFGVYGSGSSAYPSL